MIVTSLAGGIGNQLFMYAAAKALALRNETDIILNIGQGFINDTRFKRSYELGIFSLHFKTSKFLSFDYKGGSRIQNISRRKGRNILFPTYLYLYDRTHNKEIDSRYFEISSRNVYLEGYWQSEKYFKQFEHEIRKDLKFDILPQKSILKFEEKVFSDNNSIPVCIGVRRYQECNEKTSFGVVNADYYLEAINYVKNQLSMEPVFYVFSQDSNWVRHNIAPYTKCRIIIMEEHSTVEDLYLMSRFKYHIISNSTYYWWGAWLANGKLVVSSKLFQNKETNLPGWHVI